MNDSIIIFNPYMMMDRVLLCFRRRKKVASVRSGQGTDDASLCGTCVFFEYIVR